MTEGVKEILTHSFLFKDINGTWVGSINNHKFLITQDKVAKEELQLKTSCATNESKDELFSFLDEQKTNGKIKSYDVDKNLLSIIYIQGKSDSEFEFFLKDISELLTRLKVEDVCFSCNEMKETDAYKIKNIPTFVCSTCVENIKTEMENASNSQNHYLTGTLGSIIGALVGSVVWILIGYFDFYASIAGYAVAYCAFYGYNLGKGKATKIGAIINIIAIVFATLFAEYVGLFLDVKKTVNIDFLSFAKFSLPYFADPSFIKSLLPSLGFGFLFAGLGSYRIIKNIFTEANMISNTSIEKI